MGGSLPSGSGFAEDLATLVGCESPSADLTATARCADTVAEVGTGWLDLPPRRLEIDGRTHLLWSFGDTPRLVLLGHFDTVWPLGTLDRWPFSVASGRATGPGVFDMKAGVLAGFMAVSRLEEPSGVRILLTSDEEVGSPTSRTLIEDTARSARAVLVLEPGVGQAVKTGRKGVSNYRLRVTGRAAHAGLEPERGVNAAVELAHQVLAVAELGDAESGTTVTPTTMSAGTTTNTVPERGPLDLDVRAFTEDEQARVDKEIRALRAAVPGADLAVSGGINRPPLDPAGSEELFALAGAVARELGHPPLEGATVGGASDGNFTAALGIPTLDGLGAIDGLAHAEGEWVALDEMPRRIELVAALCRRLLES